jgi:putative DNA-invertase from lambdoid prophage Rac
MGRTFAYLRVSTVEQTTENQLLEIQRAGFDIEDHRVVVDTVSGSVAAIQRPGFKRLLDRLERHDVLVVTKIDRLGRSAIDIRQVVDGLAASGVRVHCLALGGVDLCSVAGRMTMTVLSAMAEFEKGLLVERTQAGLARAKASGKRLGRPPALRPEDLVNVRDALDSGASLGALAKRYNVSRSAIQRAAKATARTQAA